MSKIEKKLLLNIFCLILILGQIIIGAIFPSNLSSLVCIESFADKTLYTIYYFVDNVEYDSCLCEEGLNCLTYPETPEKKGYSFIGWYDENGISSFDYKNMPSNDLRFYAKWAQIKNEGFLTFEIFDGNAVLTSCDKSATGNLTIPSTTLDGFPVINIGDSAFLECIGLTSVSIPASVTSIGYDAFYGCSGLETVEMGDGVTIIYGSAFLNCNSLSHITLSQNLTKIGYNAFWYCTSLEKIELPANLLSIEDHAFYNSGLKKITIPAGVTSISNATFMWCENLKEVTILGEVKNIGEFAFYHCSLTELPDLKSVENIGRSSFDGCFFTEAVIPNGVKTIGQTAFSGCINLTRVNIPQSIESIGYGVFAGCNKLTSIEVHSENDDYDVFEGVLYTKDGKSIICYPMTKQNNRYSIPFGVENIGDYAFSGNICLTEVEIPSSVTYLGESAFEGCIGLSNIDIPGSIESINRQAFYCCTGLKSVKINDGVTYIESGAFLDCTGITIISISSSVKTIYPGAFYLSLTNEELSEIQEAYNTAIANNEAAEIIALYKALIDHPNSSLSDIYYNGTEAEWNAISIGEYNDDLGYAAIHYNSFGPVILHTHSFVAEWQKDSINHWNICNCGEKGNIAKHTFDKGTVTKAATADKTGIITYKCKICGYKKIEIIPKASFSSKPISEIPKASIIKGNTTNNKKTYDYKTTVTFTANVPEGGSVQWFVDGNPAGNDKTLTVKDKTESYTIQAVVTDKNGNQTKDEENITIKNRFWDVIVWFFMHFFNPKAYDIKQ